MPLDQQTVFQRPERRVFGDSFHLHPVGSLVACLRIQQSAIEAGFVAQQQEPLRVGIQSA
jgi:hypothetical protein